MEIQIISSIGTGNTMLSAFDHALKNAGVLNYNLIPLSSVIPTGAEVVRKKYYEQQAATIGQRLYVVKADMRTNQLDNIIGSGIGWYFFENGGVFVEHEAEGYTTAEVEAELKRCITTSLQDLCQHRNEAFSPEHVQMMISVCPAIPSPRCALVIAVFKAEEW